MTSCIDSVACIANLRSVPPVLGMMPFKPLTVLLFFDARGISVRLFFIKIHQICDSTPGRSMEEVFKFRYAFYHLLFDGVELGSSVGEPCIEKVFGIVHVVVPDETLLLYT